MPNIIGERAKVTLEVAGTIFEFDVIGVSMETHQDAIDVTTMDQNYRDYIYGPISTTFTMTVTGPITVDGREQSAKVASNLLQEKQKRMITF